MSDNWDKAGVLVNGAGLLLLFISVTFTGCQVRNAQKALRATTQYNVEKDYSDVFKPIASDNFQKCFGKESNSQTAIAPPNPCQDVTERQHLFDILSHYRLLLDLEQYGSLENDYVNRRLKGACDFLTTKGTTDTIEMLNKKDAIDQRLISRINEVCGDKK